MFVHRMMTRDIRSHFFKGKAILIIGPRQAGKTTWVKQLAKEIPEADVLMLNGDDADVRARLSSTTAAALKLIIGTRKLLIIDEAQRIPGIGLTLKIIVDQLADTQVIATGSSAFDLLNATDEALTGRKYLYHLLPFAYRELVDHFSFLEESRNLSSRLIHGSYPEIVTHPAEAEKHIRLITSSYLYKDVLAVDSLRRHALIEKLLRALALQCGSEVSYHEVAQLLKADPKTIEKYIGVLEQAYILFTLPAFARNLRNEIKKSRKVFFYDCGIRNAILGNFLPLEARTDVGVLWENYCQAERQKLILMQDIPSTRAYFWRTTDQREIDYVEENPGGLFAFEFKWNAARKTTIPKSFKTHYPEAHTQTITPDNVHDFLGKYQ
jgi:predicted AAA+ superfamily ATPase